MKHVVKRGALLFCLTVVAASLAGCAGTNGHFNCDKVGGRGVGCASLDQVNQMANEGQFTQTSASTTSNTINTALPAVQTGYQGITPKAGMPLRYGEAVQNVWIAPYVDQGGNYHWPQMVSVIVSPGHWVGAPLNALQQSVAS